MKSWLKAGKVLSTIVYVASLVVVPLIILSIISVNTFGNEPLAQIGGTTVYGLLVDAGIHQEEHLTEMLVIIAIYGIAAVISSCAAMRFFAGELKKDAFPSQECGRSCRKAGLWIAAVKLLAIIVSGLLYTLYRLEFAEYIALSVEAIVSMLIGICFVVFSFVIEASEKII